MYNRIRIALIIFFAVLLGVCLAFAASARSNGPPPPRPQFLPIVVDCSDATPFGEPTVPGSIKPICKTGYLSYFDTVLKVPRLVTYSLTSDQTFGCLNRYKSFHVEPQLGVDARSSPSDYQNSNFDLGHFVPDQDMSTEINRVWDAFSMANVAPQLPKFNREGWEALEQNVRDWAWKRGEVIVNVGPIFVGPAHLTIGLNDVAVSEKFYKIVIDPKTRETIAFIMDHVPTRKGDMERFRVSVLQVEKETGITFPLPDDVDKSLKPDMWPTDDSGWRKEHKTRCSSKK